MDVPEEPVYKGKRTKYKRFLSHSSPYSVAPRSSRKSLKGKLAANQQRSEQISLEISGVIIFASFILRPNLYVAFQSRQIQFKPPKTR